MAHSTAPTSSLPLLGRLASYPHARVVTALANLRVLYFPQKSSVAIPIPAVKPPKRARIHTLHDSHVPDSGYASAESESNSDDDEGGEREDEALELLRADPFERDFTIKWLTGLAARADNFLEPAFPISEAEAEQRSRTLDEAVALLSAFVAIESEDEDDAGFARSFNFPVEDGGAPIAVQLIDAPMQSGDHTSVGLQSWASAILFAARMSADPAAFGLGAPTRVLELGAGTGLLSLVTAKIFERQPSHDDATVVATDFHPDVLTNLERNVAANFPNAPDTVQVCALDWEHAARDCDRAPLNFPFPVVLAADVVYAPEHASWLRSCAERVLARDGVFWMVLAQRGTGRHEGLVDAVGDVFPAATAVRASQGNDAQLAVLYQEEIARTQPFGRADEGGYRLYKIGWTTLEP